MPLILEDDATILYEKDGHTCIAFTHLVAGHGIQANQFLIIDEGRAALIDPGGDLTYTPLSIELSKRVDVGHLDYIFASHQDPDIIASLPRWIMHTDCKIVTSKLWSRFLPHLASTFVTNRINSNIEERIISVPDQGTCIDFGRSEIKVVPAHFLHSVGNFQFYDPVSKILFSGDMGASLVDDDANQPVTDFKAHIPHMEGFHQRYMASNKACRLWANMVSSMDVEMIVPQHGSPFIGKPMVDDFLKWISALPCGLDIMTEQDFRCP
ncbi:Uncharacterised protein [BD1-7 clade bacterium]|uniref:Metallo-beta-lactamase domain-containing protein n=1 Tax=BD1-7 clade bacterium TaxID=2029982 RepID=A0A5S9NNA9_9GAMM|nr:Uncharacterised protein [BD1-7 clade bacterium]